MTKLLHILRGGDRRSIGRVAEVVATVEKEPARFKYLVSGLFDPDPIVRMRAADAMEKISGSTPMSLQPFKAQLVRLARETDQQELRWHLAQMVPRLELTAAETWKVTNIFIDYLSDDSKIVVTFAMQALADLAIKKEAVSARVLKAIETLTQNGSPAIQARGKKLLPGLKKLTRQPD
jgi:hypothetical protein